MYKPPTKTPVASKVSGLRKLEPRAKRPIAAVLERFSLAERRLLDQALSETLECVYHHSFRRPTAERRLVRPLPSETDLRLDVHGNDDSGLSLLAPPRHKVLTTEEERELFLRLNYCRYRVMLVVRRHHGKRLGLRAARELVQWTHEALQTRSTIVRLNTSLVMAMARRTRTVGVELSDLVSEGNLALLRCSDKFDCSRGFKFSTYACRAIVSAFIRLSSKAARYRGQFPAAFDPSLERSDYLDRKRVDDADDCVSDLKLILAHNSADLSTVERRVINARFVLDGPESAAKPQRRPPTLEQVGTLLGVSKERVRQIQNRALSKLRTVLEEELLVAS